MTRYGMLINTKKCVGCSACRIACQMKNHLDPEESFIKYHEIETGEVPQRVQRDRPHTVHALRGRALRCRVSDACHLHHRFRRGAGGRGKVHRLQVLHGCVSLRRPHRAGEDRCGGEVPLLLGRRKSRAIRRRAWEPAFRVRASSAIWTTRIARSTRLSRNTTHSRSLTT